METIYKQSFCCDITSGFNFDIICAHWRSLNPGPEEDNGCRKLRPEKNRRRSDLTRICRLQLVLLFYVALLIPGPAPTFSPSSPPTGSLEANAS